jgi:GH15 family glucan-1,4-alpha-glucosidase
MAAGTDRLDAACLLIPRTGFGEASAPRVRSTISAIREELGSGTLLYRFSGARDIENAFVACSFWLVDALVAAHEMDDAASVMDAMVSVANDVGLYSEEIDPDTLDMLGNFPQGLSHLALLTAASTFEQARTESA